MAGGGEGSWCGFWVEMMTLVTQARSLVASCGLQVQDHS